MEAEYVISGGPGILLDHGFDDLDRVAQKIWDERAKEQHVITALIEVKDSGFDV